MKATQILAWLRRDFYRFAGDEHLDIIESSDNRVRLKLYSDVNQYSLHVTVDGDNSYLGAVGASRKPRAGESHTRGNDLYSGTLSEETWDRIKNDIISFELVRIRKRTPSNNPSR